MAEDLFKEEKQKGKKDSFSYTAEDIEVLEGLEPVRRRPGMYIGGTDEGAMHHLVSEVFDNAMDEAVAGYATRIEIDLSAEGVVTIRDNGRGIPVEPHPKFPKKSALEVIMTTLHSGGKFSKKAYYTSGGLHGVGVSVVNALSDGMKVEVARDKRLWTQKYSRGAPITELKDEGVVNNRRGTTVAFHPDPEIFGTRARFKPKRLYNLAKSKAYLFKGVEIRWSCDPVLIVEKSGVPEKDVIHFPNGLADYLAASLENSGTVTPKPFVGEVQLPSKEGRVEWAIHWPFEIDGFIYSYCNTVPTPLGGTHEAGLRNVLYKGLREYGEMVNNKKASQISGEDVLGGACSIISLFYHDPEFQGQTKERLVSTKVTKLIENAIRDHFDNWLSSNPDASNDLLEFVISKADERLKRKSQKEMSRKSIVQKLRLPGKLADCTRSTPEGTELFLVEGDSAGGSAKQARNRETQAILPLRGKILNVASATSDKIMANQEIKDMLLALGCGSGENYREEDLRYEKIVIMTDADVDGAHIAALLMTFFFQEMRGLIDNGHLYLAQPPLYRIIRGAESHYANDEKERDKIFAELSKGGRKVDIGRFKGLGEMTPPQLKETTMNPSSRTLLKVKIADDEKSLAAERVEQLMGKNPELRFKFIQEQTALKGNTLATALDV